MLESVRDDLLKETVMKVLIDTDSHADLPFPPESMLGDTDLPPPPSQACVAVDYTVDEDTDGSTLSLPLPTSILLRISM